MSSIGARQQLRAARAKTEIAKSVLKRFRIDNAPGIKYVEAREYFDRAARACRAASGVLGARRKERRGPRTDGARKLSP